MGEFRIKKGLDINLLGAPRGDIVEAVKPGLVALQPLEFTGLRQRLLVAEGDRVKRGTPLLEDKRQPDLKLCAPASGTVQAIIRLGPANIEGYRQLLAQLQGQ